MPVHYEQFSDISIDSFDAVVVGAGFAGAVVAQQLSQRGNKNVLIIEKRSHIAGNMYDERDKAGILVHRYGPHIFHSNSKRVYDYLQNFTNLLNYQHRVLAKINNDYIPVPFNKTSLEMCFGKERAQQLIEKLIMTFGDETQVTITELREQKDPDLSEIADYVYKNVFLYYTQKQWGLTPDEVDPSVVARVPVRISTDDRYFQDTYQGMPSLGYTDLFEKMLSSKNITVCLNTEAESVFELVFENDEETAKLDSIKIKGQTFHGPIIFTGPLDELFLARFGRLPYRSLNFVYETHNTEHVLPCGTVNYTVSEDYTRVTEFKYMTMQDNPKTTIMKEYSCEYENPQEQIPYYAIINEDNTSHYQRYCSLVESLPNFYLLGRLAEYRYYNMDVIIERALSLSDRLLQSSKE